MRRWIYALLAALVLAPGNLAAQAKRTVPAKPPAAPKAAEPSAYPLETLRIQGNQQIPTERILTATGLKLGQRVAKADFDAARDRLIATGAFENVGYEYKPGTTGTGFDAVFEVVEVPQLFGYRFEDVATPEDTLRTALRAEAPIFTDKIPPSKDMLERFAKVIERVSGTKVTGRVTGDAQGNPVILFRSPNPRMNIAEVHVSGNDILPSPLLMRRLSEVAVGVPYTENGFRQILEASLRPLYEAQGHIRVSFPKVTAEPVENKGEDEKIEGLSVSVVIDEGPAYRLSNIRWQGVAPSEIPAVQKAADLKTGDIANFDEIEEALKRVKTRYMASGFLKVKDTVTRQVDDPQKQVLLAVTVDPGPQYVFGKLSIVGLDILSEPVIKKMWQLDEGKPFPDGYAEKFLQRVRDEDLFDNLGKTSADTRLNDTDHTVDVTLFFTGAAPQNKKRVPGQRLVF